MSDETPKSPAPKPEEITRLLTDSSEGSEEARDKLLELVFSELHMIAQSRMRGERDDHTLSATALVNETYLRLFKSFGDANVDASRWPSRSSFFSAAATAMRRVLVDHARATATKKRGGGRKSVRDRVSIDVLEAVHELEPEEILSLDEAISRLESMDERAASVIRLRFFAGLDIAQAAQTLEVSERTVKRDWEFARAWLRDELADENEPAGED